MSKQLKTIRSIFQQDSLLHTLSERAQQLAKLDHLLRQALPDQFRSHCHLADIKDDTLIIQVDNAAYANLIRFQTTNLIGALQTALGITLTHIDVKVNPALYND